MRLNVLSLLISLNLRSWTKEAFHALWLLWFILMLKLLRSMVSSVRVSLRISFLGEWKPHIDYYDFYAQNEDEKPIRQTFPFVKVLLSLIAIIHINQAAFLHLYQNGVLDRFQRLILVSDGGMYLYLSQFLVLI